MFKSDNASSLPAEAYDQSVRQVIPFYDSIIAETLELVKTVKPQVDCWLDTGCGTGYPIELALLLFPQADFILTDPSEAMLKQAISRFNNLSNNRVSFLPSTPSENLLAFEGRVKPQVISAILSHHYLKPGQRREATEACYQLLETEGIFVTIEIIAPDSPRGLQIGIDRWKHYQVEHGRSSLTAQEHIKRFNSTYFPITVQEHIELLKSTGFRTVELFWFSHLEAGFYAIK